MLRLLDVLAIKSQIRITSRSDIQKKDEIRNEIYK